MLEAGADNVEEGVVVERLNLAPFEAAPVEVEEEPFWCCRTGEVDVPGAAAVDETAEVDDACGCVEGCLLFP